MPPKKPTPESSRAQKAQTESTSTWNIYSHSGEDDGNDVYNEEEMEDEASSSNVTGGNTRSGRPRPRPTRQYAFDFDRQAGQPLVPNKAGINTQMHGPPAQTPASHPNESGQEYVPQYPPSRYPSQMVNYPPKNSGRGHLFQPGSQPTNWNGIYPQQSMPSTWGHDPYGRCPAASQYVPRSSHFYESLHTQQPQPLKVTIPPPPPPPPTEAPTKQDSGPAAKEDPSKAILEAEHAKLKAQKERRDRENEIRQELEVEMQQLRDRLEKTKREASIGLELAKAQGERDALKRYDEIRREEEERQKQAAEQRMEMESEIRVKLEVERLAELVQRETKQKQFEELQRQAVESILERLDDAVTLSQAKLLQGTEMVEEADSADGQKPSQDLLLSEMKTSITSHLRRSFVLSQSMQESDRASSPGRGSRSNSRSGPPHRQVEGISVSDALSSRSEGSSLQSESQAESTDPPPPVPDAPTEACDMQQQHDYMTNHFAYNGDDWNFMRGYWAARHDPGRHEEGWVDAGYRAHGEITVRDLVHRVTCAVLKQLTIPQWDPPIHTTPNGRPHGENYPAQRRESHNANGYPGSFDEGPPYGDVTAIYDSSDEQGYHEESDHVVRHYKRYHPLRQPIAAFRSTPPPFFGTTPNRLPSLSAEESSILTECHVEARSNGPPRLLGNNDSLQRGADTDSDAASMADSDSTIFHEASETMAEHSTGDEPRVRHGNSKSFSDRVEDETPEMDQKGMFAHQMELWKERMMKR